MPDKNEKVVHTRVSNELYEKISDKAKKHRVTVSNLIRNLVEDYLEISGDVFDMVDNSIRGYLNSKRDDSIIGYQPLVINKDVTCGSCPRQLKKGENAYAGLYEKSPKVVIICENCREKNISQNNEISHN